MISRSSITLLRDVLREPEEWVPTLALRLGAALRGPPASLAKHLGPNEHHAHPRSGVPPANPELRDVRGTQRDHARRRPPRRLAIGGH